MEEKVVAYIDGSYNVNTKEYGTGVYLRHKKVTNGKVKTKIISYKGKDIPGLHNVTGEIKASMKAINYCKKNKIPNLDIYYDYSGIEKWANGEWGANNKYTKNYKNMYDKASKDINIKFHKVPAHSKNRGNDMADMLAKTACMYEEKDDV